MARTSFRRNIDADYNGQFFKMQYPYEMCASTHFFRSSSSFSLAAMPMITINLYLSKLRLLPLLFKLLCFLLFLLNNFKILEPKSL